MENAKFELIKEQIQVHGLINLICEYARNLTLFIFGLQNTTQKNEKQDNTLIIFALVREKSKYQKFKDQEKQEKQEKEQNEKEQSTEKEQRVLKKRKILIENEKEIREIKEIREEMRWMEISTNLNWLECRRFSLLYDRWICATPYNYDFVADVFKDNKNDFTKMKICKVQELKNHKQDDSYHSVYFYKPNYEPDKNDFEFIKHSNSYSNVNTKLVYKQMIFDSSNKIWINKTIDITQKISEIINQIMKMNINKRNQNMFHTCGPIVHKNQVYVCFNDIDLFNYSNVTLVAIYDLHLNEKIYREIKCRSFPTQISLRLHLDSDGENIHLITNIAKVNSQMLDETTLTWIKLPPFKNEIDLSIDHNKPFFTTFL